RRWWARTRRGARAARGPRRHRAPTRGRGRAASAPRSLRAGRRARARGCRRCRPRVRARTTSPRVPAARRPDRARVRRRWRSLQRVLRQPGLRLGGGTEALAREREQRVLDLLAPRLPCLPARLPVARRRVVGCIDVLRHRLVEVVEQQFEGLFLLVLRREAEDRLL